MACFTYNAIPQTVETSYQFIILQYQALIG